MQTLPQFIPNQKRRVMELNNDCDCEERFILRDGDNGELVRERLPKPEFFRCHSCAYVHDRNTNIPRASQLAKERAGNPTDDPEYGYRWTREFVNLMDELWEISQNKQ
jgi:hypothetical protein